MPFFNNKKTIKLFQPLLLDITFSLPKLIRIYGHVQKPMSKFANISIF